MRWLTSLLAFGFMTLIALAAETGAQEISFWEEFALSDDRRKTLEKLVPGSEDYYFFHALHAQNEQQLDEVDSLLKRWTKRHGKTQQVRVIENRQALLKYGEDPTRTLDHLIHQLNLDFSHQRRIPQAQKDLPTALAAGLIDPARLMAKFLNRDSNGLGSFNDRGLYYLVDRPLNTRQRRDLLKRIQDPTFPGIVELISKDLKGKDSSRFGSLTIHNQLTKPQLEELAKLVPELRSQQNFVNEFLLRLLPSEDINLRADADAYRKYLDDLWAFVDKLNPNFNSLKASVLYRLLELDQREGKMDRKRFIAYLELPRNVHYINPRMTDGVRRQNIAVLGENYSEFTSFRPINNDEDLVQDYLHHFLAPAANSKTFAKYFEADYLKRQFATAKILYGNGDRETWAAMLTPEQYKSLLERIDLDFAATNQEYFGVDEAVELKLFTKNVDKLIVKVFEINTRNFYLKHGREVDTDISLDGLVANEEQLHEYDDAPLLRKSRTFTFDSLNQRGVYVIDFIGGGKSSRALVRKGRLQMVGRVTPFGQRFNVVNEQGAIAVDATLSIAGRNYTADEDGDISVPFSTRKGTQQAIVSQGQFSSLQVFQPVSESYSFQAAFHVNRESLAQNNEATVIIRPSLSVAGGNPIPLKRLDSCQLEITSTSLDGVSSTKTIGNLAVSEIDEATATFLVPPRLHKIEFRLEVKLKTLLKQERKLSASESFTINQIDVTKDILDLHLLPTAEGWFVEVLGKSGERREGQPVRFKFGIAGLNQKVSVDLQSDDKGQIELGDLSNVDWIEASAVDGTVRRWNPNFTRMHLASNYHLAAGDTLALPVPDQAMELDPRLMTLLETRGGRNVRDCFAKMKISDHKLEIANLEPGDYRLTIRSNLLDPNSRQINIRVATGTQAGEAIVGKHRLLQKHQPIQPFAVAGAIEDDKLTVQIADVTDSTRVHVFPVRYLNAFDPFDDLNSIRRPEPWKLSPAIRKSAYMAGRKIGEEYQYILNRRYAPRFPGNMLERPSLLMNPWAIQDTENKSQSAAKGEDARDSGVDRSTAASRGHGGRASGSQHNGFSNLDFLGGGQDAILNVQPDEDGQIQLTSDQIGNAQAIRIVVVDLFSVAQTQVLRQPRSFKTVDQRLVNALDAEKHYRQARQIDVLEKGDSLIIEDILSAQFQQYDELSDVYGLYQGFGNAAAKLRKFSFVLDWTSKTPEEKRGLYSEFACHELNFFIYQKDEKFFKEVVRKHILNKRERTFLDQWLLEEDLTQWLEPWHFARLNIVEKILLSQRYDERRGDLARHIAELYDLAPTPRSRYDELYRFSLMSRSLEGQDFSRMKMLSQRQLQGQTLAELDDDMDGAMLEVQAQARFEDSFGVPVPSSPLVAGKQFGGIAKSPQRAMSMGRGTTSIGLEVREKLARKGQPSARPKKRTESRTRNVDGREHAYSVEVPVEEEAIPGWDEARKDISVRQLYRRVEPTREWIENNYYELLPEAQNENLVTVNQFWKDYANHEGGSFASQWFAESNRNFTEMMFALAVLDLPMSDVNEKVEVADGKLTITADGPMIVLHQQNREAEFDRRGTTVFVSENFFQSNDRHRYEDGIQFDRFVEGNFLANVLYGAEVVITNPTSTPMAIEVLLQIPRGAMPAAGSKQTRSISMQLDAFSTQKVEYAFYFPAPGEFTHYPAHVSSDVKVLAVAENRDFNVVDQPASVDRQSWEYVSQNGSEDDVIDFLNRENVQRIDPAEIAFRMKDKTFFKRATDTLRNRCRYDHTLWAYGVKHNEADAISEFLEHADGVTSLCGISFKSELLTIDPFVRNWYEQHEFSPLVNARAHQLGVTQKILNSRIHQQYEKLTQILGHHAELDGDDRLVVTYFLLLQDRVYEAMNQFARIESKEVVEAMPYAYCDAYLDLYREKPDDAMAKAKKWTDYPVDRWRSKFENVVAMVEEIKGGSIDLVDEKDRNQQQDLLASKAPGFDFRITSSGEKRGAGKGSVEWRNLTEMTINYYVMDIEFLFSANPFARDQIDGFSMIRPNLSQKVTLVDSESKGTYEFPLPEQFDNKNVLVEVVAGDDSASKTWYANSMEVQVIESYGQVLLTDPEANAPISKAYVKVFAKGANGDVEFHKDGYTDLRGRFDYVTQSNRSLDGIAEYAILIISDEHGAVIREAKPPRE
ncbi:hypothetical protein [Mariniblastus fucicola]|uniref:MG2 domain protein n=1 Tax=Mariniblastus fucicola TaxID=980251 RepID=A0A5B9P236_9BACT|nr:hypothetical protein [Mariniblastus fucicola]QEG20577.1 hypothetical protein MFFC18_04260 [Mariniblastus fucicola]